MKLRQLGRRLHPPRPEHKVCDDLAAWVESCTGAERWVIDPPSTATRPVPNTVEADVDPTFAALYSLPVPERALVKIPNARLRGVAAPPQGQVPLIVLPNGEFVGETVALTPEGRRSTLRNEPAYRAPLPAHSIRKPGNFYAFVGFGARNYYHWNHDHIMGLRGAAAMLPPDTQLIVNEHMSPFQVESLRLLGLDDHPRVPFPAEECWELENLYVVTPRLKGQIDTPEAYHWYRDAAFAHCGVGETAATRRLHLSRRDAAYWRTINEAEVEQVLGRYGFETIEPGALTFCEQVTLFAQAETIVGIGAGLFNMVFAAPGGSVLQLQDRTRLIQAFWTAATAVGLDYHYLLCDTAPNPGRAVADIRVPIDKLEASLEAMGIG